MNRYIDADQMLKDLPRLCHSISKDNSCRACPLFDTEDDYCMVERFIEEEPSADVVDRTEAEDLLIAALNDSLEIDNATGRLNVLAGGE